MSRVSNEEINNIRNSVNIVDVISSYIPLTKRGKNYFGVCPFHDDRNPSLSVSPEKQIYTCFSCGASGNVFNFIMDYDHLSFIESLKKIASIGGVKFEFGYTKKENVQHKELYEIYNTSQLFYQNNINTEFGKKAKEYLFNRDFTDDVIKEFKLGLSLKENDMLTNLLIQKKFKYNDLIKSGLIVNNNYGYRDIFYNRIMFPIEDVTGQIVGYSGRTYNEDNNPKYINTMETEIFKKGELIYNYNRAKNECRLKKQVIIVEGFMDVIRCHLNNVLNVVATMGTAVTKKQALLIKKLSPNVIICFDGDNAGSKAMIACADELIKVGIIPKIVRLENKLDPDDYIKEYGIERFKYKIDRAIDVMNFKMIYYKENKNLQNDKEMAEYINIMLNELKGIDDDILVELTLQKLVEDSGININVLKSKLKGNDSQKIQLAKKESKQEIKTVNKYIMAEQNLLYYMLRNKEVIAIYNNKVSFMPTARYRFLAQEIYYFYKRYKYFDIADFFSHINDNDDLLNTVGEIENLNLKEEFTMDEIEDYIRVIREYHINYECNRLLEKLNKETDVFKKAEIAEEIKKIKIGVGL